MTEERDHAELSPCLLCTQYFLFAGLTAAEVIVLTSDWTLERDECPASNLRMWILVFIALRLATDPRGHSLRVFVPGLALIAWGIYEISTVCSALESSKILMFVKVFTWLMVALVGLLVLVCLVAFCKYGTDAFCDVISRRTLTSTQRRNVLTPPQTQSVV